MAYIFIYYFLFFIYCSLWRDYIARNWWIAFSFPFSFIYFFFSVSFFIHVVVVVLCSSSSYRSCFTLCDCNVDGDAMVESRWRPLLAMLSKTTTIHVLFILIYIVFPFMSGVRLGIVCAFRSVANDKLESHKVIV